MPRSCTAQYLDKPLKEHTLLQAITRTNRVYPPNKTHGLIVDYLGVFDDVAKAFKFDETSVTAGHHQHRGTQGRSSSRPSTAALAFFPGVDRTVGGYEGLIQAQAAIADDATKDAFGLAYSVVSQLWEAISPDPMLQPVSRLTTAGSPTSTSRSARPTSPAGSSGTRSAPRRST